MKTLLLLALITVFGGLEALARDVYLPVYIPPAAAAATFTRLSAQSLYTGTSKVITNTNTAGAFLIIGISGSSASDVTSVADSQSDTIVARGSAAFASSSGIMRTYTAANINGGVNVITFTSTMTDTGVFVVQYSGPTAFDVGGADANKLGMATTNTTTGQDMVFTAWANEATDSFLTNTLSPGNIIGVVVTNQTSHIDRQIEFLNSGAGFAAGTYTNSVTNSTAVAGMVTLFLKQ